MLLALLTVGCALIVPEEEQAGIRYVSPTELWEGEVDNGIWVVLEDVVVTSPRAADAFYVQERGGGPGSGVRVDLTNALNNWPPDMGTPMSVYGPVFLSDEGPSITLHDHQSAGVLGVPESPVAVDWSDDPQLAYALVVATQLRITSAVDPIGRADSTGPQLAADFGVQPPGFNRVGDATGVLAGGRISLRDPTDWSGEFVGDPPTETTIADVRNGSFADGTPVMVLEGLQIAPWSRGERWTAIQDPAGDGLWVDAEFWGVGGSQGDMGVWTGEVRTDGEGLRLRVWADPVVSGVGLPIEGGGDDGDLVRTTLAGLSGPDDYGEWLSADWIVDDRFLDLEDLASNPSVLGIVREDQTAGARLLAVIESTSQ